MAKEIEIPKELLESYGLDVNKIMSNPEVCTALKKGNKTPILYAKTTFPNGKDIFVPMKIHLYEQNNNVCVYTHPVQAEVNTYSYKEYKFTQEEKEQLLTQGKIDHPITLEFGEKEFPCLIGVDWQTKEVVHIPTQYVFVSDKILGVEISNQAKTIIQNGGEAFVEGFNKDGNVFPAFISYDFNKGNGGISFRTPSLDELQQIREERCQTHKPVVEEAEKKEEKTSNFKIEKAEEEKKVKKSGLHR